MKTSWFFLCIRPPLDDTKQPSPAASSYTVVVSGKISGRRRLLHRKRVAPERPMSIKSNGNTSEVCNSENLVHKDSQRALKIITSVSEANFPEEESISLKQKNNISNQEVNHGYSGAYFMVISLFFTVFLGKFFGILSTLIFVCSPLYIHRKIDGNDGRKSKTMVADSPEQKECHKSRDGCVAGKKEPLLTKQYIF
ncbi:hypothetical protein R6Q59_005219 [Mikania micrantha]|uniref:Uncharacterized protein n=1 Tax=Mikania micrantha TaxID=192012 RepID=A0A5N6Q360_9ASTR|nr:hypothetical protein E3N88_02135 [Mikania micrantha]